MALRMQRRNEKFFTLSNKAGSNVVESGAILMEFAAALLNASPTQTPAITSTDLGDTP